MSETTSDHHETPAGGAAPAYPRDAIIFIPAIMGGPGMGFDDVALRVTKALERQAARGEPVFSVETHDVQVDKGGKVRAATIMRHETTKAEGRPLFDLYEFDYRPLLHRGFVDMAPFRQALAITGTLALNAPSLVAALGRRSKGLAQKLQVVYGAAIFLLLAVYLGLLLAAVIGTAAEAAGMGGNGSAARASEPPRTAAPTAGPAAEHRAAADAEAAQGGTPGSAAEHLRAWFREEGWLGMLKNGIVGLTLLGFAVKFNLRAALDEVAPPMRSMADYLASGICRTAIVGELARLVDYLDEAPPGGVPYRNVHVMAYSFGSILTIDALFQKETEVSPRFSRIHTLVTIGSPFDFIRTFWPDYFCDRHSLPGTPARWINIYSEVDVLGSNFLDEPRLREKLRHRRASPTERRELERDWKTALVEGVDLHEGGKRRPSEGDNIGFGALQRGGLSLGSWLRLMGFRVHMMYWDPRSAAAVNCFDPIVTRLYSDDKVMRALV